MPGTAVVPEELRPLMFSIAYRMLGSVVEAEDVVQDAYLRIEERRVAGLNIENPEAFASTVATRLAIDALRSARRRREVYVGPWMPEPLPDDDADPAHRVERDETLSFAFLAVLERLGPVERAVFLLREVFAYDYPAIAEIVGRDEPACRQILHRAKARIADGRPRFDADEERDAELTDAFFAALEAGDVDRLVGVLADDVVFYGDGGGRAPAIREPLRGSVAVARFLAGLVRRGALMGVRHERRPVNGTPALWVRAPDGALLSILMVQFDTGTVQVIANQLNPGKLTHLGPVGDLYALIGGGASSSSDGAPPA
ncbi:RNA polymerase sigma factor SigJ [Agromyces bauzanensis]|uniref:RNA polymerase sigma factor SigJ n=1 Tax=Agromyces bauzanensis TaxID=1308924 RepID=A0A917UM13_9MICO|nr:RNA polymerase sigma factor SigJ [Agromyces bauzanensis]GGJ67849.1 RNA polymerase sigma factor SigJ [Agromyces bauzanensis]